MLKKHCDLYRYKGAEFFLYFRILRLIITLTQSLHFQPQTVANSCKTQIQTAPQSNNRHIYLD